VCRARRAVVHWREARRRARADRLFDEQLGVDTATWVRVPDLDTSSANVEDAVRYEPTSVSEFELLMGKLRVDHHDFTFVDYGSGKGRVLMLATRYPFKRIVGVEFAEALHGISCRNIATLDPAEASRIDAVLADATDLTDFEPPLDPLVLYFFHPFGTTALHLVLDRVLSSLERQPRPAYIVLTGPPDFAEAVEESGFKPVDVDELGWMTRGVFVAPTNGRVA
jgi:hypothetical protein